MEFNITKAKKFNLHPPKKKASEYNQEEFKKGIKVESEHTSDKDICAIIAANHLDEIPDYYTRLHKMEAAADKVDEMRTPIELAKLMRTPIELAKLISEDINYNNGLLDEALGLDIFANDKNRLKRLEVATDRNKLIITVETTDQGTLKDVIESTDMANAAKKIDAYLQEYGYSREEILGMPSFRARDLPAWYREAQSLQPA